MLKDRYDNPVATASQAARDAYVRGIDHLLAAEFGAMDAMSLATAADPDFALAHVGLARACMMSADMPGAQAALAGAQAALTPGQEREASHVAVFARLLSGDMTGAREAALAHVAIWPRDALVAQLCTSVFGLIGFSGLPGREAELLAYTAALLPHYGEDWWMLSMHAISLCETGQAERAETLMDKALALNPRNANAAHFKAHSIYEQGDTARGRAYLTDWLTGYDKRGALHGHLNWHSALWALDAGDAADMWARIDDNVRPEMSSALPINTLTDLASILYRAELAGIAVPQARWDTLSAYASRFFPATGNAFADVHAALAHAMAGRADELDRVIATARGPAGDVVAVLGRAWRAIAAQDWTGALPLLTEGMADHARIGGSRAQRDMLEFALLGVLLRLGKADEARRILALRRPGLAGMHPVAGLH